MSEVKTDVKPIVPMATPNPAPASGAPVPAPAPTATATATPTPTPAQPAVAPTTTSGLPTPPAPPPAPPKPVEKPDKPDRPKTLHQKLADIHDRVEAAANSRFLDGKAEEFAAAWEDLDAIGSSDKPHEAAMIQAAHNHLQHRAPRRASEIDALEQQLDEATDDKPRPQAVPDSPQLADVKRKIANLQTDLARDPRALPGDVERAQQLQERVDAINTEKATAGAK